MKVILAACAVWAFAVAASAGEFGCPHCQSFGGTCVLKIEQVDDEQTCYDVECEEVCIPAVHFPWESCRTRKCGRARVVAKLKKESRDTKTCKYEWVLVCDRCGRPVAEEEEAEEDQSVPPAPKPASKSKTKSSDTPPMPPAAPPAAWMPPSPYPQGVRGVSGVSSIRPVIMPRQTVFGYSIRSNTR